MTSEKSRVRQAPVTCPGCNNGTRRITVVPLGPVEARLCSMCAKKAVWCGELLKHLDLQVCISTTAKRG